MRGVLSFSGRPRRCGGRYARRWTVGTLEGMTGSDVPVSALLRGVPSDPAGVEEFLGAGGVAGLLFTASWCAAGVLLARDVTDAAPSSKVPLLVVDCEAYPHLADRFQVRSLPTFVLMRGEREEGRLLGAFSAGQVRSLLERPALDRSAPRTSQAGRKAASGGSVPGGRS